MKLPNVTPYADCLLVWVDPNSIPRTAGGVLLPDWQRGDADATLAVVAASPVTLSAERGLEFPDMDGKRYTYADLVDIPQPGNLVFLRANTFRADNEYPGLPGVFIIALDRVLAVVDNEDNLSPFQGLLLAQPVWEDDVRLRPDGVPERYQTMALGGGRTEVITETDPIPLDGLLRVTHAGNPLRGQADNISAGCVYAFHRMAFTRHARKQDDIPDGTGPIKHEAFEPRRITLNGQTHAIVHRQLVMGQRQ